MRIIQVVAVSLICCPWAGLAQTGPGNSGSTAATKPASKPIPKFLVYRHFLAWAESLSSKATAAGESDPYQFAEPFQRAGLNHQQIDALLKEAKSLDSDLASYQQRLQVVVAKYREDSSLGLSDGAALPLAPPEIQQLEAMRTAILIQHMVKLHTALGAQTAAQLDAYLEHEFVPHMSLGQLAHPPAPISPGSSAQPLILGR